MAATAPGRALQRLALPALAVLMLTACQARLTIDIDVAPGGGGRLTVTLAADEALQAEVDDAGVDPLAELAQVGRESADERWTVTDSTDPDGWRVVALAADFDDADEFNDLAATLADALNAPEARLVERLTLRVDPDVVRLDGVVGAEPGPAVVDFGLEPAEAVALVEARDAFVFEVTAALPGTVIDTTGEQTDTPLRWQIAPGERVAILAVAEQPTLPWWPVAAAAAALLVAVVLVWMRVRRRRRRRLFSR